MSPSGTMSETWVGQLLVEELEARRRPQQSRSDSDLLRAYEDYWRSLHTAINADLEVLNSDPRSQEIPLHRMRVNETAPGGSPRYKVSVVTALGRRGLDVKLSIEAVCNPPQPFVVMGRLTLGGSTVPGPSPIVEFAYVGASLTAVCLKNGRQEVDEHGVFGVAAVARHLLEPFLRKAFEISRVTL